MMNLLSPLQFSIPLLAMGWGALFLSPFVARGSSDTIHKSVSLLVLGVMMLAALSISDADPASSVFMLYLGGTLMFGLYQWRLATRERISRAILLPCLGLTLLYAPSGLLAFSGLRVCQRVIQANGAA